MKKVLALIFIGFLFLQAIIKEPEQQLPTPNKTYRSINHHAFKAGEILKYRLRYGVMDAGEAVLTVKTSDKKIRGREILHVMGTGKSLSVFNVFFKVNDRYETYMDKEGIFPWIFLRRVEEGDFKMTQDYTFYQDKKKVIDQDKKSYKVPANVQDMISAFYYARTLDFQEVKIGQTFTIKCFVDGETWPLKIKFIGRETIKVRKKKFKCLKFRPVVQKGRIFKKEEDLNVWITDDDNKIPVKAKAKILVGSINMELVSYSGLTNKVALAD